jgi:hypothetical protein
MTTAAITTSRVKPVFEAKPKLKVWSQANQTIPACS